MSIALIIISSSQYLSFILLCILLSFFLSWFQRKTVARMQNRVGPPLLQPLYDFLKLSAKEDIYVNKESKIILKYIPVIQLLLVLLSAFLLPIIGTFGFVHFEGDLFLYISLFALGSATIFIIANFSKSPYSLIGGNRSIITEISLEIPLIISLVSVSIFAKTLEISSMSQVFLTRLLTITTFADFGVIVLFIILFFIIIISYLGVLELNPFSTPKAETEIVSGWKTELTGKDLAIVELSEHIKLLVITSIIASIFLGNSFAGFTFTNDLMSFIIFIICLIEFIIKILIVVFIASFIHVLKGRSRIHTIAENFWYLLILSSLCFFGVIILEVL